MCGTVITFDILVMGPISINCHQSTQFSNIVCHQSTQFSNIVWLFLTFYTAGDDTSNSILPQNPISVYTRSIQKRVTFRIRPVKLLASSKLAAPLQLTHTANCAVLRDQFELLCEFNSIHMVKHPGSHSEVNGSQDHLTSYPYP